MTNELIDRITELEIKLAHQELTIDELNDIVTQQQSEISLLKEFLKVINNKIKGIEEGGKAPIETPPPHY